MAEQSVAAAIDAAIHRLSAGVFATVEILGVDVELIVLWMAAPMS